MGLIYNLSLTELKVTLRHYVTELFLNGFIQHFRGPTSAPIFIMKKKDSSLYLAWCQGLNIKVTICNRYGLPLSQPYSCALVEPSIS